MKKEIKASFLVLLIITVLTGVLYPLGITIIAKVFFPRQAQGSLIVQDGKVVGSALIGQNFDDPRYLWGRLSATTPAYNAASSSGSNLGPSNPALLDAVKARIQALQASGDGHGPIPVDLVTSSASGLDPDVSPAAAQYQMARILKAGGLKLEVLQKIIRENTTQRTFGILGEPHVNVLKVNLALKYLYDILTSRQLN